MRYEIAAKRGENGMGMTTANYEILPNKKMKRAAERLARKAAAQQTPPAKQN
jgi:hypothetical protein